MVSYLSEFSVKTKTSSCVINKTEDFNSKDSFGLGLKNIYERYRILGERSPQIRNTENFFEVELPITQKK